MKKKSLALLTTTTFLATLGLTVQTPAQTIQDQITTFDPPGSYSTGPTSINPSGEIAGYYFGPTGPTAHGFVRDKDGTIISFDAGPGLTVPTSINPRGTITGSYVDASFLSHGFARDKDGTITSFDADPKHPHDISPTSINPSGEITGSFFAVGGPHGLLSHGFVRAADGSITIFDADPPHRHLFTKHKSERRDHRILLHCRPQAARFCARCRRNHHYVRRRLHLNRHEPCKH
jgi:hypothetical protein